MSRKIDHFAIGAQTLAQGVAAMKDALGVEVPQGSKHDMMSTHNCVMQAGHDRFFELIAIDSEAPDPGRPRWFTLDDPGTRKRLNDRPRALCWVVNTDDLDAVIAASPVDLGEAVRFQRGGRSWRLTVPKDGHLPENGLLPAFIQWSPGPHPSTGQQNLGVTLLAVQVQTPDVARMKDLFRKLQISHLAEISEGPTALSFVVESPNGTVTLD